MALEFLIPHTPASIAEVFEEQHRLRDENPDISMGEAMLMARYGVDHETAEEAGKLITAAMNDFGTLRTAMVELAARRVGWLRAGARGGSQPQT